VRTLSDGSFAAVWTPEVTGNYLVRATVEANSIMNGAAKTITMALVPDDSDDPEDNVFTLNSNSTVRLFAFDPDDDELSFDVEGPSGTTGYVDLYIPKAILSDVSALKAYVDEVEVSFESKSLADSWLISFSYSHSTHRITMELNGASQPINETFNVQWVIYAAAAMVIVSVAMIALVALKRRR
jgi:hypothetical protein